MCWPFNKLLKDYIIRNHRVPYDVVNDAFRNSFLNLAFRARSPRPNAKLILHSFFNFDFAFSAAARPRVPFRVPISFSGALCIAIPVVSAGLGARTHLQRFPCGIFFKRARAPADALVQG